MNTKREKPQLQKSHTWIVDGIPKSLWIEARKKALGEGTTMKQLFIRWLDDYVAPF